VDRVDIHWFVSLVFNFLTRVVFCRSTLTVDDGVYSVADDTSSSLGRT
jgi:hypothetical protein